MVKLLVKNSVASAGPEVIKVAGVVENAYVPVVGVVPKPIKCEGNVQLYVPTLSIVKVTVPVAVPKIPPVVVVVVVDTMLCPAIFSHDENEKPTATKPGIIF